MEHEDSFIGLLEYNGALVSKGTMDARKTARALLGFDGALRHFVGLQNALPKDIDYEIPVTIRKGSWQALIPDTIEQWILTGLGIATTTYLTTAAKRLAENDFKDVDIKKAFRKAFLSIQWMIRLGKHIGTLHQKRFENVKWREGNTLIGIPNAAGEYLFVPKLQLDMFVLTPSRLLSDIASLVVPGRSMRILAITDQKVEEETIVPEDRHIFYVGEDEKDELFPELTHGEHVTLEGIVTRGNENTNSIGFRYMDHILNCVPQEGSIVRFKMALFLKCRIHGVVNRIDEEGNVNMKKPSVVFYSIEPLEEEPPDLLLFEKDA